MNQFDVIIVGGGIAGASLGAMIADKRRTLIIEAEDHCAIHSTGRSAAFWLAHYGGPEVMPLTLASLAPLNNGWPTMERSWLRRRGGITIARRSVDLGNAADGTPVVAPLTPLGRCDLENVIPGLKQGWDFGLFDPSCADIDVAGLHQACLAHFRRLGGTLKCSTPLTAGRRVVNHWLVESGAEQLTGTILVNAAGAWADDIARRCSVRPLGIRPYRRTIVQLRVGQSGLKDLPLVNDALGQFYFKGEGDNRVWVSPHDEIPSDPCDAAPEEIDIATAIDRFEHVVDWPVERVERSWAGLRSFGPLRIPIFGYDSDASGFFWCAGQGGVGIQTAAAAAMITASLLLDESPDPTVAGIDSAIFSPNQIK